ncbi:hypothetical protein [uncultured Sphingomonas sp.]|uniref:hypothetical protein n=1 Tax=uncultured Sphingomonas sp. TaxID=158754 RepID=UPI00260F3DF3|nr:hypothetical protein [uncultured Sphingomonas sp.]
MGIDDRDYMRARYRQRANRTRWNEGRGRIEAAWLDPHHQRYRRQPFAAALAFRFALPVLGLLLILIPFYGDAQRHGWIPDLEPAQPFPESGSVTVAGNVVGLASRSYLTIAAADSNAVVQLMDPDTNAHALSIYVAANERVTVPVAATTYRVRLIEGRKWHGAKRYFGPNTSYETVAKLIEFTPTMGHIIDLHRRPGGNLETRMMGSRPAPL